MQLTKLIEERLKDFQLLSDRLGFDSDIAVAHELERLLPRIKELEEEYEVHINNLLKGALKNIDSHKELVAKLESKIRNESDTLSEVLERMPKGVSLTNYGTEKGTWTALMFAHNTLMACSEGNTTPLNALLSLEKRLIESKSSNQ